MLPPRFDLGGSAAPVRHVLYKSKWKFRLELRFLCQHEDLRARISSQNVCLERTSIILLVCSSRLRVMASFGASKFQIRPARRRSPAFDDRENIQKSYPIG